MADWTDDERLATMYLYSLTPFGRLHSRNPDIIALASRLGRTPSSVAMKLSNFASLDPIQQQRGVAGLRGASRGDRAVWEAFQADWTAMVERSAEAFAMLGAGRNAPEVFADVPPDQPYGATPTGPTTVERLVAVRRGQDWFRAALKTGYEGVCCVSGCDVDSMLVASHIVPWAEDPTLRLNPHNGLLLSAIHDRAFEHGLLAVDDDMRVLVATSIRESKNEFLRAAVGRDHGRALRLPNRFAPDRALLRRHRESRFRA
jgi:DNA (cytosine-5)-methyltransferase 1/putative restriction endonuclease